MRVLTHLVLLSLCVWVHGVLLQEMVRRHAGYGADDQSRPYGQVLFAAIPLHGPVPLIHVLSKRLVPYERTHEPSVEHPVYVRAPYRDRDFAPSAHNEYEYAAPGYEDRPPYLESYHYGSTRQHAAPSPSASEDDVTIIYARPDPRGGYTYRRKPTKKAAKRTAVSTTESPVVLRVHRYKVVKDN